MPDKPDISFSLWSIMKNSIGKDLSKIPIPVNFSEPLSFLQVNNTELGDGWLSVLSNPKWMCFYYMLYPSA